MMICKHTYYFSSSMLSVSHGKITYMANSIGERIKIARKNAGFTQQKLADCVRVSRAAVAQWESGETKGLKPENLVLTAEKLAISIKWLATGEGPMDSGPADIPDQVLKLARLITKASPEKVQAILVLLGEQGTDPAAQQEQTTKEKQNTRRKIKLTLEEAEKTPIPEGLKEERRSDKNRRKI
ncbi:MAG: helix-turn-helix domain-containing protein [Candidatus Nitrosoglobus sp.]